MNPEALGRTDERTGTHLLPQAYPDGSPTHPSYPGGHAVTAGSNATILKAYFDEGAVIENPVTPDPDEPTQLTPYDGDDTPTVGGEINTLATNMSYTVGQKYMNY